MPDLPILNFLAEFGESAAILALGVSAYCWVRRTGPKPRSHWNRTGEALVLSALVIYTMLHAVIVAPGVLFDARYIVQALAVLFSGPLVGTILTVITLGTRLWIGGDGIYSGTGGILIVFAICMVYRRGLRKSRRDIQLYDLVTVGVVMVAAAAFSLVLLVERRPAILDQVIDITIAQIVILPIGLMVLGALIMRDDRMRKIERARADEHARFCAVVNHLPVTLALRDLGGTVTLLNRRFETVYGVKVRDFIGRPREEFVKFIFPAGMDIEQLIDDKSVLATRQPVTDYVLDTQVGGAERSVMLTSFVVPDAAGQPGEIATIGLDITELRRRERRSEALEAQLVQAGKMEAIGQLAGGIAHDFNNLLGAIIGFAAFLAEDLPPDSEQQFHARRILRICDRAKALVSQVLAFSRADRVERKSTDIRAAVLETRDLLRPTLPPTTELVYDVANKPVHILANDSQLSQIIVNLCINSSDSLAGKPGTVTVALICGAPKAVELTHFSKQGDHSVDRLNRHVFGQINPERDYARLIVKDTGSGMDAQTLARVTEPFFTTKERGRGTGLGLAVVHGIMAASSGAYMIESEPGKGTAFTLYFPCSARPGPLEEVASAAVTGRGTERILVIDDEVDIRDVFTIALERLGYEVACIHDPLEALEMFRQEPDAWDLVLTDQVMPGMSGVELIQNMKLIRPHLKAVLCTGFSDRMTEPTALALGIDLFLAKPVEPHKLAASIRMLLDRVTVG